MEETELFLELLRELGLELGGGLITGRSKLVRVICSKMVTYF